MATVVLIIKKIILKVGNPLLFYFE